MAWFCVTLCAASGTLPLGSDNPQPLIAADMQCDGPNASAVWLIGTHHKTGTELNGQIMRRLPPDCGPGGNRCAPMQKCDNFAEPECVAAVGGGGIAFAEHISIMSANKWHATEVAASKSAGSPQLRAAHWVRDPTEIIMSGFFYHKVTDEAWVHVTPNSYVQKWFAACELAKESWRPPLPAAQEACSDSRHLGPSARSGSYQALLNALSDEKGVLVEAWRAGRGLAEMNATMHVLGGFPKQAITVDLGDAEAECERVFGLVFKARRTAPRT